jgi:hypothetical protein
MPETTVWVLKGAGAVALLLEPQPAAVGVRVAAMNWSAWASLLAARSG